MQASINIPQEETETVIKVCLFHFIRFLNACSALYAPINVRAEEGTPGIRGAFDYLCYLHPREID